MTVEQQMQFPFTKQDEILDWATLYIDAQKPKRKRQEEDVIKIKCSVNDWAGRPKIDNNRQNLWKVYEWTLT